VTIVMRHLIIGLAALPAVVATAVAALSVFGISLPPALADEGPMPDLGGAVGWLNSAPLTSESLRGKVVLVDFWTYTCINLLRPLPYIKAWADKYKDAGLIVIGVHTPEFSFEKELESGASGVDESMVRVAGEGVEAASWSARGQCGHHQAAHTGPPSRPVRRYRRYLRPMERPGSRADRVGVFAARPIHSGLGSAGTIQRRIPWPRPLADPTADRQPTRPPFVRFV
jgi:thiol-disulfide isomerase/thioredoxin